MYILLGRQLKEQVLSALRTGKWVKESFASITHLEEGDDGNGLAFKVVGQLPPQPHIRKLAVELVAKEPVL